MVHIRTGQTGRDKADSIFTLFRWVVVLSDVFLVSVSGLRFQLTPSVTGGMCLSVFMLLNRYRREEGISIP